MKQEIIRCLANKSLSDKLQNQGYAKEAAIAEYEVGFEKSGIERMAGRELSYGNLRKFLRKSRW